VCRQPVCAPSDLIHHIGLVTVALLTQARGGRSEGVRECLQLHRCAARSHVNLGSDTINRYRPGGADHHFARVL
jgi:hypothetical protein